MTSSPEGQNSTEEAKACSGGYECRNLPHFEGCLSGDHETRLASLILGDAPTITNWTDARALAAAILADGWRPPVDDVEHHIVEFREQGWTIKHPLACRPNLFECPVNRAAEREFTEPPEALGRFVCGLAEDGQLIIGTEVRS